MAFEFDPTSAKPVDEAATGFDPSTAEPVKPSGVLRKVADKAVGFGAGAVGATKAITDVAGAGNPVSGVLDAAGRGLNSLLSPEAQADQQEQQDILDASSGKGVWEGVKAGARAFGVAPVQTAITGLGSVVPTVAAGLATGGASVPASLGAMGAVGLAQGAGTVKGAIYDDVLKRHLDAGKSPEEAQAAATAAQEYGGPNSANIAIGAGLGVGDALTGVTKTATSLLRRGAGKAALAEGSTMGLAGRTIAGAAGEVPLEAVQGGQEKLSANVASAREGFDVDPMDGVVAQGTLEGLASAAPGGAFGAFNKAQSAAPAPAATPAAAPPGPLTAATLALPNDPTLFADAQGTVLNGEQRATSRMAAGNIGPETGAFGEGRNSEPGDGGDPAGPAGPGPAPAPSGPMSSALKTLPPEYQPPPELRAPESKFEEDDILDDGHPFRGAIPAARAARQAGPGFVPVKVEGGYVVRRGGDVTDVDAKTPGAGRALAAPADAQPRSPDAEIPAVESQTQGVDAQKGASDLQRPTAPVTAKHLKRYGITPASVTDAERRFSDGQRVFIFSEQDGHHFEAKSIGDLAASTPDQMLALPREASDPAAMPEAMRLGRGGKSITEGAKPFKTKLEAVRFQKAHFPQSRIIKHKGPDGGFVLRGKSDSELEADRAAGVRRAQAGRQAAWEKNPFLVWLGDHGLYHAKGEKRSMKVEYSPDKNPMTPAGPLFRRTGTQPDLLAHLAAQAGFLPPGSEDARALEQLIHRVLRGERIAPMYAEGELDKEVERRAASFGDLVEADLQDPFAPSDLGLEPEDLDAAGYDDLSTSEQAEFRALVALAQVSGVDTDALLEDIHYQTASDDDYYQAATQALQAALAGSDGSGSAGVGQQGEAGSREQAGPSEEVAPAGAWPKLEALVERVDTDFDYTTRDLWAELPGLIEEEDAPASLMAAFDTFQDELDDDRDMGGRGDLDTAEENLMRAVRAALVEPKEAPAAAPTAQAKPDADEPRFRPETTEETQARREDEQAKLERGELVINETYADQFKWSDSREPMKPGEGRRFLFKTDLGAVQIDLTRPEDGAMTNWGSAAYGLSISSTGFRSLLSHTSNTKGWNKDPYGSAEEIVAELQAARTAEVNKTARGKKKTAAAGKPKQAPKKNKIQQEREKRGHSKPDPAPEATPKGDLADDEETAAQAAANIEKAKTPQAREQARLKIIEYIRRERARGMYRTLADMAGSTFSSSHQAAVGSPFVKKGYIAWDVLGVGRPNAADWSWKIKDLWDLADPANAPPLAAKADMDVAISDLGKVLAKPAASPAPDKAAKPAKKGAPLAERIGKAAKKKATPDELRAKADLGNALADLGDILSKPGRMNITPEQEAKLLPALTRVFDAAFRLGFVKFKQAAKYVLDQIRAALGDEVAAEISIDHLQGAYIAMAGKYKAQGADTAKAVVSVETKEEIEAIENPDESADTEGDHVPSPDSSVERDSGEPAAQPAMGDAVSDEPGPAGQRAGDASQGAGSQGLGQQDDPGLPASGPALVGKRGDQQFPGGKQPAGPAGSPPGDLFSERGGDAGNAGVAVDPIPASAVAQSAGVNDERGRRAAQRAAAGVKVKPGDLANIRESLPYLLEGQQEDVQKAETRFAKPDGYGLVLTNGTGTGKTFSGLGTIKRFERQGKKNILIVVPDEKIGDDWIASGAPLDLPITRLADTKDAGKGIVITTYANLGQNDELARRDWDLVIPDEAHMLMQAADGEPTLYLQRLRAITHHPDGNITRHSMLHRELIDTLAAVEKEIRADGKEYSAPDTTDMRRAQLKKRIDANEAKAQPLRAKVTATRAEVDAEVAAKQGAPRARMLALTATPFAYEKTIDWGNGYLFDYKDGYPYEGNTGYNTPGPREYFFITHLGYRMRYGKLTEPDSKVDRGLMQRQFNGWLKKQGALSGRMLEVPADYDRRFILVDNAIGNQIDAALDWLSDKSYGKEKIEGMSAVRDMVQDSFDYLSRRYLLEAIKAQEVVPIVKQHLKMGRKVVVFHDYNKGGGFNPFDVQPVKVPDKGDPITKARAEAANTAMGAFRSQFPELVAMDLAKMRSPIETFRREFGDELLLINGLEKQKDVLRRYTRFQDDGSGPLVALVQADKNKGWSGHDTTGKMQRVLINLGQPTQPTRSIQQEGRIYRTGQVSDAVFRYMSTGTNWEKWAFATTIATRASTAENLGMGELARALKDAFIAAYEEADAYPPGHEGEGTGGKDRDKAANNAITEFDRAKAFYFGTQKKNARTKAQEGKDYFATPEPVGLKMAQWAGIRSGEDVLEPSAGHGAIARWFPEKANRTAVEPSSALRSRLAMVFDGKIVEGTFEDHNVVNKYDGIVMNPPFGVGGKTAVDHLEKAATHLRDGGRIVALLPRGPMADKRLEAFLYDEKPAKPIFTLGKEKLYRGDTIGYRGINIVFDRVLTNNGADILVDERGLQGPAFLASLGPLLTIKPGPRTESQNDLHLIADIVLPQVTFERAGTTVATHIIVLQKGKDTPQQINRDYSDIEDINALFDRLEHVDLAERAEKPEPAAAPPKRAETPASTVPPVAAEGLVEHTTAKGKVIRGVIRTDLTYAQAKAIDKFTFKKDGGFFIREKHLQGGTVAKEERAVYRVREPQSNYDVDLFPSTLDGLQDDKAIPKVRKLAAVPQRPAPTAVASPVLALREKQGAPGVFHVTTQLVQVGTRMLPTDRVIDWDSAADALSGLSRFAVEHFDMLITDADGKPMAIVGGFKGAVTQTSVYPATLAMEALRIEGAAHAWAVHNHPSGSPRLSDADRRMSLTLDHLLFPSTVEFHGFAAVARQPDGSVKWAAIDADERDYKGQFTPGPATVAVPVVEREIMAGSDLGAGLTGPTQAREIVRKVSGGAQGLLLLDAQSAVTGWMPMRSLSQQKGEAYDEFVNALAGAGTSSVVVANPGGVFTDASIQDLKERLAILDIRILDAIDTEGGQSMAQRGVLEPDDLLSGYDEQAALEKQRREEAARKKEEDERNAKPEKSEAQKKQERLKAEQVDLFNPQGGLFLKRPGQSGMDRTAVDRAVSELTRDWLRKPDIRVIDSMEDAPEAVLREYKRQESQGGAGVVHGFHMRGTVYLVADALGGAADIRRVLFHESLGHFGLRGFFGKALNPSLEEVVARWKFRVAKKAKEYGLDMAKGADRLMAAEEVLAELAQTRPELDIVQRVVAIIRTWLREHVPGFQNLALTDAEVIEKFILPARGFVERGRSGKTTFSRGKSQFMKGENDAAFIGYLAANGQFETYPESVAKANDYHHSFTIRDTDAYDADGTLTFVRMGGKPEVTIKGDPAKDPFTPQSSPRIAELARKIIAAGGDPDMPVIVDDMGYSRREAPYQGKRIGTLREWAARGGDLNPDDGRVQFSKKSVLTGQDIPGTWQGPDASKLDDLIYSMQDKHVDTRRVLQKVRAAIGAIADEQDPYLQEELYHGRAATAVKEFLEKSLRPLLADLLARGIDMSDFEEYLHNRHAERRNIQVAKVNPAMPDGGSGILTADARAYLAGLTPDRRAAFQALARRVDAMTRDTRAQLVASGLEKQSTIDAWQAAYGDEYVPLMREDMDNASTGIGQGYSVRGAASKRALGSNKPVADIIANIALQREKTITRAEKRRIGEALYGLALKAPNPEFWFAVDPKLQQNPANVTAAAIQLISMGLDPMDAASVAKEPTQSYIDPVTKQVTQRINPALRGANNVLAVRIDGEDKFVFFNSKDQRAMRMVAALKNLDADQLGTVMGTVSKMTRYFSAINTQYNPIFGVTNLTRDLQTALLNLNSTPLKAHKSEVMKNVLAALRGIYIDLRDHRAGRQPTSAYAQIFEEFQREGGATGYRDMYANAKDRAEAIGDELKAIKQGKAMSVGRGIMGWLSDYNESMENAVRVSAYKVAKEQGMSNQQAASLAKNLTVNFNRKGQVALQAGALYAFFNASVQGTARIGQTMFADGKLTAAGQKIIGGGILLGTMQALLLALAGFDDEEPPQFVRERSLVLPVGGDRYVSIPMPLGFHILPNLGRIPTEWAMGGFRDTPKRIGELVGLFADAFNPMGSAGLSLQTLTPTIIDPLAALSENRDFTGKPIARKDFDSMRPTAGHTRAKDTATPWARLISYAANAATGGTDFKPGIVSPTPDQVDYLIGQVTGGVGREAGKLAQVAGGTMSGEQVPMHKIPLVGRFVGTTEGQSAEASRFYNNLREIGLHKVELDGLRKANRGADAAAYLRENPQAQLVAMAERQHNEVTKMVKAKRALIAKGTPPEQVRLLDARVTMMMKSLNDRVRALP
jgi:hypothetical protein